MNYFASSIKSSVPLSPAASLAEGFLSRGADPNRPKPKVTPYGCGYQLAWKVRLYPKLANLYQEFPEAGWTHLRVNARTIETAVSLALAKEQSRKGHSVGRETPEPLEFPEEF